MWWLHQAKRLAFRDRCARVTSEPCAVSALDPDALLAKITHHVIDNPHCVADGRCLEAHAGVAADELVDGDTARCIVVEVDALHWS